MILRFVFALGLGLGGAGSLHADGFGSDFYHDHYRLQDPYVKLVDNYGNGYEALYGVRNFREVLKGILYRGGANNFYNKNKKRNNRNPLPDEGLKHLCQEGFHVGVYLYATNYKTAKPTYDCSSLRGPNHFEYLQIDPKSKPYDILKLVYAAIFNPNNGPVYVHCWNGWHASGMISALALRQFCGVSGDAAAAYWVRDTDGNKISNAEQIKATIRQFVPYSDLSISPSLQAQICPAL